MRSTSVTGLKARLSEYLSAVKAGEEVVIRERGKPVARLVPIVGPERAQARLDELVRAGLARRGTGRLPRDFWDLPRPADPDSLALKLLLEEREESR